MRRNLEGGDTQLEKAFSSLTQVCQASGPAPFLGLMLNLCF